MPCQAVWQEVVLLDQFRAAAALDAMDIWGMKEEAYEAARNIEGGGFAQGLGPCVSR